MGVRVLISLFIVVAGIFAPASALAFNTRITVYASVAEMRNIYVNKAGRITKIAGNTSRNIPPGAFDENNRPLQLTDDMELQYEAFLKSHNYYLSAGKYYYPVPSATDTKPGIQTIRISSAALSLD